ncbi:MAG TPA: CAP domain-containing protein [Devosia sp.]|nr:CAP domain-containing protein [Devosia sp.]
MLLTRRAALVLGAGASLSACASIGGFGSNVPQGATTPQQLTEATILAAINQARQINGNHKPMTYNAALAAAARSQANLMAEKDTLAHDLGVTLRERVTAAGYQGAVGENIAGGQQTLQQAIEGWLNSPGHRATLLSDKFTEFGLAVARVPAGRKSRYGIYWCFIAGGPFGAWMPGAGTAAATPSQPAAGGHDTLAISGGLTG